MTRAALTLLAFVLLSACSANQNLYDDFKEDPACKQQGAEGTDGGVGGTGNTPCHRKNDVS